MSKDQYDEVRKDLQQVASSYLPDPVITLGYLEHMIDLMAKIQVDQIRGNTSPEAEHRVQLLESLLEYSSVDFENIEDPFQAYKIPKTQELKRETRRVQDRYLRSQVQKGIFGT